MCTNKKTWEEKIEKTIVLEILPLSLTLNNRYLVCVAKVKQTESIDEQFFTVLLDALA